MDFLDPQKQKAHARRLALGYAVLGMVLLLATVVLLYRANGFGVDRNLNVIQNGLVFVSSRPAGATVYVNGREKDQTNTRMTLPAGAYTMELKRSGYHTWKRALTVEGSGVERFDYPFLVPRELATSTVKQYTAAPGLFTQSPDRRWLITQGPVSDTFELFDLNDEQPVAEPLELPADIFTAASQTKAWQPVEWAEDNRRVVLRRTYDKAGTAATEYILFDREDPEASQNLSVLLGVTAAELKLRDGKYDQYYLYDPSARQLLTATLKRPTPQPFLKDVLAYAAKDSVVAFATPDPAKAGRVLLRLHDGDQAYTMRQVPAGTGYVLDLARYAGTWYVAAGAQSQEKVYVYEDPFPVLKKRGEVLVPVHILKVPFPAFVSFSPSGRFVMAENATRLAVFDAERGKGYGYELQVVRDIPAARLEWADGYRLSTVSGDKLWVFDFDGTNLQAVSPARPGYLPAFDRGYRYAYGVNAQHALVRTALLTKEDL